MSMGRIGGDIVQMAVLKATFASQAANIDQIRGTITSNLQGTHWEGKAASEFRAAWEGEFSPVLAKLSEALNLAGVEVKSRMDALESAGS